MTRKSALYALAVAVLTGTVAVAALADEHGTSLSEPADSSVSPRPEQVVEQPNPGEAREPMETGTIPDPTDKAEDPYGTPKQDKDE